MKLKKNTAAQPMTAPHRPSPIHPQEITLRATRKHREFLHGLASILCFDPDEPDGPYPGAIATITATVAWPKIDVRIEWTSEAQEKREAALADAYAEWANGKDGIYRGK